ncbi:MAG: hypothetical protein QOF27_2843 [Gaiellaceae bacterium]|jgi:hypothetical protein|nr:hypothetical protein [Gaiellaceae bacterium]
MSAGSAQTIARSAAIVVAAVGSAALARGGRRRLLRWGATEAEIADLQPGDELIVDANVTATRAITVRRSPDAIWPWLAQLGQGRAGFYSYDALENLLGFDIHSADHVVPDWQQLEVGDEVRLTATVGLKAAIVEPGRALVLQGDLPIARRPPFDSTWAFILCEQPDGTTRLLSRERYGYKRWWAPFVVEPTQAMSFVMSRKMLLGIRDRAERCPTPARATSKREEVRQ